MGDVDPANVLAIVIGLMGLSGCIFTALSFRRRDTGELIAQQSSVLHDMEALHSELRLSAERFRAERDECREARGGR